MLVELVEVGRRLEDNNHAVSTKAAYARDFAHFTEECTTVSRPALSAAPETVYLYLSALVADDNAAGYAVSTLDRRLAAIGWVHEKSDYEQPLSPRPQEGGDLSLFVAHAMPTHEESRTQRGTAQPKRGSGRTMQRTSG